MLRRTSASTARHLAALLLTLMVVVGAGSPALAAPVAAVPAAAPAAAPAIGGIDLPCVLPSGLCKDIKETGKEVVDKTIDRAKWICDKAKKVCEVAGDAAKGVKDGVDGAIDTVSDTIDFATDPLGYLAKKSSPSVGKLVEAIATDGM
ncbi:hypothetical protein ACIO6T_39655 [Streptomyces sp. NPDC087532]|uniref:hypothetical protein n=1 Tax=Streptomyces sp. NPDC087532 TaxID=3365795 RepID=UPI00380A41D9